MSDKVDLSKLSPEQKKEMLQQILRSKKMDASQSSEMAAYDDKLSTLLRYQVFKKQYDFFTHHNELTMPYLTTNDGVSSATTYIDGKELINFCGYNYLNLSGHPYVNKKACEAIERYGTSVSASRTASGNKPLHVELEKSISSFLGTEDTLVFPAGYLTNVSVISHLIGPQDLIVHDILSHNSILAGSLLSHAHRISFPHNDYQALAKILNEKRKDFERALIIIEGVYSLDGDIPNLPEFIKIKKQYGAWLMIDEAHSVGVIGKTGRGIGEYYSVNYSDVEIWMGTLSKALASCGGYISGKEDFITYFKYTCPGFLFSAGISPANTAAALAALEIIQKEPERVANLQKNGRYFLSCCQERGLDTGFSKDSAVVPIVTGDSALSLYLSQALKLRGIYALPIVYPAVEKNAARLRFFIDTAHTEEQLKTTADCVLQEYDKLKQRKDLSAFFLD